MAGNLQVSANNSLNNYLNDQSIQENWNAAQQNVSTCNTLHVIMVYVYMHIHMHKYIMHEHICIRIMYAQSLLYMLCFLNDCTESVYHAARLPNFAHFIRRRNLPPPY